MKTELEKYIQKLENEAKKEFNNVLKKGAKNSWQAVGSIVAISTQEKIAKELKKLIENYGT